jgi:RNA-directed DNA polymerase
MPPLSNRSQAFLQITNRQELADWFGVSDRALRFVLYKLSDAAKYKTFEISKRNGGTRQIDAPSKGLKSLQASLSNVISEICPARELAKGYVKAGSIYEHARIHKSKKWVILVDLESFFPSINFGRVRGMFLTPPFSLNSQVATCLAQLCCKDNGLPQGSPCSPSISNAICRRLDRELLNFSKKNRLHVSRYADDICFSTNFSIVPGALAEFSAGQGYLPSNSMRSLIEANGFKINGSKFKVYSARERKLVTGLVVNSGVSIAKAWKRRLRSCLHLVSRLGPEKAAEIVSHWLPSFYRANSSRFEQSLRGKLRHVRWVDRKAGRDVVRALYRNYPMIRTYLPKMEAKFSVRLMSEGESDLLHLEAAYRHFNAAGKYQEFKPKFLNFLGGKGDNELWQTLIRIAKVDVDELTIGVFDCDNPAFMAKNGLAPGCHVRLGRMVFAICLSAHDGLLEPYCIECLYSRSDSMKLDSLGRRLFFKDEFDDATGRSLDGRFVRTHPKAASLIVDGHVTEIATQKSVLLSKMSFARAVHDAEPPFDDVHFSGFGPTFDSIEKIVHEVARSRNE